MYNITSNLEVVKQQTGGVNPKNKITTKQQVVVKRAYHSFSKVVVAAALAAEEMVTPIYGQVRKEGELVHPLAYPDKKGFLKLVSDVGRVTNVWEKENVRLYEVDCPKGWTAYSGAIPWTTLMDYFDSLGIMARYQAVSGLHVEIEDRIPIFVTEALMPKVDFLTFVIENSTEEFKGWCAGPALDWWPRNRRQHIVLCRGDNMTDEVSVNRDTMYA